MTAGNSPPRSSHSGCHSSRVTSIWPGRCNNLTNLPIIAVRLGTCHRGTTDSQSPKINTMRPSGGPCYPRGCQYCRFRIKEHFIRVCDSKRGRKRETECTLGVMEGVCGCPGWPVCIKPPREDPRWCAIPPDYRQAL